MSLRDSLLGMNKGAMKKGTDALWTMDFLPTGLAGFDHAMSGGFVYGRSAEVYGTFASGKSALVLMALANNQRRGGQSVLLCPEMDFNADFFRFLGGDPETLFLPDPDAIHSVEGAFGIVHDICVEALDARKHGDTSPLAIGLDSLAAMSTGHLDETGMSKVDMSKAKVIGQGLRYVSGPLYLCRAAFIMVNQERSSMDMYKPSTTPGGEAPKYAASHRIRLTYDGSENSSKIEVDMDGEKVEIGRKLRGQVMKSKSGTAFGKFWMPFYSKAGFKHPTYTYTEKGIEHIRETVEGVDQDEALFSYYRAGAYTYGDTDRRVVQVPSKGWYCLHKDIDPEQKSFRESRWPEMLGEYPQLRTLLYDALQGKDSGNPAEVD